jgi:undecaprenyl-diphosphatase
MAGALWAAVAAAVALGGSEVFLQALAQRRPYAVVHGAEVLVRRTSGYALPSVRGSVAGAIVGGLAVARRWRLAALAVVATLALLFSGVYVGAEYPLDVAAGGALGIVVAVGLWPLGSWVLVPLVAGLGAGPLNRLVAARGAAERSSAHIDLDRPARLPNARAMEALRAASEAARHATFTDPAPPPSSVRTKVIRRDDEGAGRPT